MNYMEMINFKAKGGGQRAKGNGEGGTEKGERRKERRTEKGVFRVGMKLGPKEKKYHFPTTRYMVPLLRPAT